MRASMQTMQTTGSVTHNTKHTARLKEKSSLRTASKLSYNLNNREAEFFLIAYQRNMKSK